MSGERVYDVAWKPLLVGKFGVYAEDLAAVWFWNKLKQHGGSRNGGGEEQLMYYRGGFAAVAKSLASTIRSLGGKIVTSTPVDELLVSEGQCIGVRADNDECLADMVITTTPLPVFADLAEKHLTADYIASLRRIKYLANICVVLELDRSLLDTYWLNINDTQFPFVGVIEHTNFEPPETHGGRHLVYLSKYLPESAALYQMSDTAALDYTLLHLQKMFPSFSRTWVHAAHVWRAKHSQPVVEKNYGIFFHHQ